jgi:cell wall-associated NlpC family hydrolase
MTTGAIISVAGLSFGLVVPAQAGDAVQEQSVIAAEYSAYLKANFQTLSVSAGATPGTTISRDGVTATPQATLDAQNAAAAAAAAKAAEAAAATAALVAAASAPVSLHGYTGRIVPAAGTDGAAIVAYAQQFVGVVPYIASANAVSPATGFECDSFVDWVFAHTTGRILPRGVDEIAALGTVIPQSAAVPGDLVVYVGQHIGIYAGNGMMVDAPSPGQFVQFQAVWGAPEYVRL